MKLVSINHFWKMWPSLNGISRKSFKTPKNALLNLGKPIRQKKYQHYERNERISLWGLKHRPPTV